MNAEETRMRNVFGEVGGRHGFENVELTINRFRDFKIKWVRSTKWISLEVCDYLAGAPDEVLEGIAEGTFTRIRGAPEPYSETVRAYLNDRGFLQANQDRYVRRSRGAAPVPEDHPLREAYMSLVEEGLIEEDPDLVLMESSPFSEKGRTAARSSALFHVIAVRSSVADLGTEVLRYILYAHARSIGAGWSPDVGRPSIDEFARGYPGREEAERRLSAAGIRLG